MNLSFYDGHYKRLYYSNTLKIHMYARVSKIEGKWPWDGGWNREVVPELIDFLSDEDAEYGKTEEDYFKLINQFKLIADEERWLLSSLHDSFKDDLSKFMLPKPIKIKDLSLYFMAIIVGILIGYFI